MDIFSYHENHLMMEDVPLAAIASKIGTPVYVYSQAAFVRQLENFENAFSGIPTNICYAMKTAANLALLKLVADRGHGADIVSGGELFKALRGGIKPENLVFSGVGKTAREMEVALASGIKMFNVESVEELARLSMVGARVGRKAPVALRINPDVDPGTHPYVATGLKESKFGLSPEVALELYKHADKDPNLEVLGVACHIGSQLLDVAPFMEAAEKLLALILQLKDLGISIKYLDMGGGLGISYGQEEEAPSLVDYSTGLKQIMARMPGVVLILEPGRAISGNSGVMLVEVQYNKSNGGKDFVVVDGAMNDLARPSLYGSYHDICPLIKTEAESITVDVVGPVCESSDFLAKGRLLPRVFSGDLLAVMSAGAYGFSMSSNYNARLRAAEVLVNGDSYRVIRTRETNEDLVRGETV